MGYLVGLCARCHGTFTGVELYEMPVIYHRQEFTQNMHVCQSCRDEEVDTVAVISEQHRTGMCINCRDVIDIELLHEMPTIYVGPGAEESYVQMAYFCTTCRKEHIDWAIKAIDDYINEDE